MKAFFLCVAALILCLFTGEGGIRWPDWSEPVEQVIFRLRLLRVATGFTVGAGLACAGAAMQAVLRNPLADPYVLGVSSGSALGAALIIAFGVAAQSVVFLPLGAFLMALLTLALVCGAAWRGSAATLILCGVAVSAIFSSFLMMVLSFSSSEALQGITWWMLGGLQTLRPEILICTGCAVVAGIAGLTAAAHTLDILTLGSETAHTLGLPVRRAAALTLALATLATAGAVALAGLVGFVGLVIPHAVRPFSGARHRALLPACALAGGLFLVVCDTLARTLFSPAEIPVGVVTALLGGPAFIAILRKTQGGGHDGV